MRFKSKKVGGFQVFAVSGTNTVSFGIDFDRNTVNGLLGFAVEREDNFENERNFVYGFKVFESIYPNPGEDLQVSTFSQPVQSFVWDDFTAKDGRTYTYYFHPLKGTPENLDRSAKPSRPHEHERHRPENYPRCRDRSRIRLDGDTCGSQQSG